MEELLHFLVQHSDRFVDVWNFFITLVGASITQLLSLKMGTVGGIAFPEDVVAQ